MCPLFVLVFTTPDFNARSHDDRVRVRLLLDVRFLFDGVGFPVEPNRLQARRLRWGDILQHKLEVAHRGFVDGAVLCLQVENVFRGLAERLRTSTYGEAQVKRK